MRRALKRTGTSWRVDETYVRIAGGWRYLYRAVDSSGATLDFYLSESCDALRPGASSAKNWLLLIIRAPALSTSTAIPPIRR